MNSMGSLLLTHQEMVRSRPCLSPLGALVLLLSWLPGVYHTFRAPWGVHMQMTGCLCVVKVTGGSHVNQATLTLSVLQG